MRPSEPLPLAVAIPSYQRNRVLIDTLEYLLALRPPPAEILVLDQTEQHEPEVNSRLELLERNWSIRWVKLTEPSITKAMNHGLQLATQAVVVFLDDDIRPEPELLMAHANAHALHAEVLVAGRVIQPWQEGKDFSSESSFHFASPRPAWIHEFMGGNFSVRRNAALAIGGFDENFVRVAFRFEAEFAHRYRGAGGRIYFEPNACVHHLKAAIGGTRSYGEHLTSVRPDHSVGAYYFSLRTGAFAEFVLRPARAVATRFHLRRPWWIPVTLIAELRGMYWAWRLHRAGPRYAGRTGEGKGNA